MRETLALLAFYTAPGAIFASLVHLAWHWLGWWTPLATGLLIFASVVLLAAVLFRNG